jgi:hypothetical protein
MAKQTFTTGQVLTAAQMTSLQQTAMGGGSATAKTASYTLVAADAGTTIIMNSGSATTVTVNTALFAAGDTVLIVNQGAGVCTVTAGTATVSTAGSLALAQYETGVLYFLSASAAIFSDYTQTSSTQKVIQVVSATTTTDYANNTTTYGDTGLTATITPTLNTSKVLVIVSQSYFVNKSAGSDCYCKIKLVRASTDIVTNAYFGYTSATGATAVGTMAVGSITYLDSPATTSATTYKTQGAAGAASTNFSAQWSGNMASTITLMEIGA